MASSKRPKPSKKTMSKRAVQSDVVVAPTSAYSQAILSGELIVTSGYLGTAPDGSGLVGGGFEAEVRQALDNVTGVLEAAGSSWDSVVRINVSLADVSRFDDMDRIYREYVSEPFPTRNTIGVASLWGGAQIGVDVWAIRESEAQT